MKVLAAKYGVQCAFSYPKKLSSVLISWDKEERSTKVKCPESPKNKMQGGCRVRARVLLWQEVHWKNECLLENKSF